MRRNPTRSLAVAATVLAVVAVGLWSSPVRATVTTATTPSAAPRAAAPPAASLGSTSDTAAGSCWEIKQRRPDAPSGAYWLLTPAMAEPARFYCDQTTDGGGWVLVAKGRNAWTSDYDGRDAGAALLTPDFAGGADVHQLSSTAVDQLLNGGRVDALPDGVRLRRATSMNGSAWQEARFKLANRDRWVWSFDAGHPLSSYTIDGVTRSGGRSNAFGTDSSFRWVDTTDRKVTGWNYGFGYGANVAGSSADNAYLYSPTNSGNALPFTLVYLRPQISSTTGFSTIPDTGTAPIRQPSEASSLADALTWGVTGLASPVTWEGDVEVQAFTQSGNRMYVGGNFRYVTADDGTQYQQSYLAAFDVNTGEWIPSFRPVLDQQVRTLATLPDGRVVAGGIFTKANGQPATGIVALDPSTGATSPDWSLQIENRVTGGTVAVRALKVVGQNLYIGGSFTHLKGTFQSTATYMRNLARVDVQHAAVATGWNPELNGTVVDVASSADATGDLSQVYAAGYFTQAKGGVPARRAAAVLTSGSGDLASPAWTPKWSSSNDYQQAIAATPGRIWVGGSEHSLFQFSPTTFARQATTIFDPKGDVQAIGANGDVLYAGCHCNSNSFTGAVTWPLDSTPWSEADTVHWVGAFSTVTGQRVPGFTPAMKLRLGAGIWAITADSNGRMWMGGDIETASSTRSAKDPSGGFARYSPRDVTPPERPGQLRVVDQTGGQVTLAWGASSDPSGVHYQVLRDDRPIAATKATTITLPYDGPARYFVRAADGAGNVSASTLALPVAAKSEVVAADASWRWWYQTSAPPSTWAQTGFDDTAWRTGRAVLGWGTASVVTGIDSFATTAERPLTAYFRRAIDLGTSAEFQTLTSLQLTGVANDGAAVYVNGVEVARKRLPTGTLTQGTYATSAPREAAATADPIVVDVPLGLLHAGANVIAVETHLNYRATPDLTFELRALATHSG
ncbi:fibrinogen-like YCDxxxxGGGW domain-containing protein [Nocardioides panacisoli]|uniref:Fibrinogen C-terminal domain-containing protein n=1 Tax=Nocardioides panacisoli TaxID=627624 RepID=A0ABP7IHN8_9ACTN